MSNMPVNLSTNQFLHSHDTQLAGTYNITLNTENTFIDKNIKIEISTTAALASSDTANVTAEVNTTSGTNATNIHGILTATATRPTASGTYYIAFSATGSGNSKITQAGWIGVGSLGTASISATKFYEVTKATGGVSNNINASASVAITPINVTTMSTSNGIYIESVGTSTASGSITASSTAAGYFPANTKIASASVNKTETATVITYISGVTVPGTTTFTATAKSKTEGTIKVGAYSTSASGGTINTATIVTNGVWTTTSITPGTSNKGPYYGKTTVVGDGDLIAGNITVGANIFGVAGTFSATNTVSSGQTAAAAGLMLSGYSAWVHGLEVQGNITNRGNLNQTITTQGGTVTVTAGYYTGGTITASLPTTTVTSNSWTKNESSNVLTTNNANWNAGYISSAGNIPPVTFNNTASNTSNYIDLSNALVAANGAYYLPEAADNGYIYITRGYIDNVKINIGRLIPDFEDAAHAASSDYILNGYHAYDGAGNVITGSIGNISFPSSAVSTSSGTSKGTVYVKTTDQYIVIPAGYNSTAVYYKFNKTTSSNYTAANIKHGVTITVGNGTANVYSVTGTFTSDGTLSTSASLRSGVIAYSKGTKYTGTMPDTSATTTFTAANINTYFSTTSITGSISIVPKYSITTAGYIPVTSNSAGTTLYYNIRTTELSANAGNVTLISNTTAPNSNAPFSIYSSSTTRNIEIASTTADIGNNRVYIQIEGTGSVVASTTGWLTNTNAISSTTATRYVSLDLYVGSYTTSEG